MTTPLPYVRRRGLTAWLKDFGFTEGQIDQMIRDGTIPQRHFKTAKHTRLKKSPRAYYLTREVATALNLPPP